MADNARHLPDTWALETLQEPLLLAFQTICREQGLSPILVGGVVRDLLLTGTLSPDIDVVVPADQAQPIAQCLAERVGGKYIVLDETFGVYRVIRPGDDTVLDIAAQLGNTLEADLRRRDATLNALAYAMDTQTLMDVTGGLDDLAAGRLRMIAEQNFRDDPLRLLRLFRLAATHAFVLEPATLAAVTRWRERAVRVAVERIHSEWLRLLSTPRCAQVVRQMADIGLLEVFFPELSASRAVPPNRYHHLGLWDHTLELLNQAEIHFPDLPDVVQAHLTTPWQTPHITPLAMVRLGCLFHDVGKPATMALDSETGHVRFYGHDAVSARITHGIARRYKWGRELTQQVTALVRWHLYPGNLLEPDITPKALRKFFRRVGPILPELILLALADRYSAQGPEVSSEQLCHKKQGLLGLWSQYQAYLASDIARVPRLLTGQDVMALLDLPPGPRIGKLLADLEDAYLADQIRTPEEARTWLKTHDTLID